MNFPAKNSTGFTVVELLVVLGIIGMVLAATISARPNTASSVAATARTLAATLQLARARAMSSNVETVVRIDTQKREFGTVNAMHALPKGMAVAVTVAETERNGDSGGVRFYTDGQSSGGDIVLTLNGCDWHVEVNWLTGVPRLSQ